MSSVLIDSNILIYALDSDSIYHQQSINILMNKELELYICTKNISEYFSVCSKLKIEDSIFRETEKILSNLTISRNSYINNAIGYYNQVQKRKIIEKQLKKESILVKKESLVVLRDFERILYVELSI